MVFQVHKIMKDMVISLIFFCKKKCIYIYIFCVFVTEIPSRIKRKISGKEIYCFACVGIIVIFQVYKFVSHFLNLKVSEESHFMNIISGFHFVSLFKIGKSREKSQLCIQKWYLEGRTQYQFDMTKYQKYSKENTHLRIFCAFFPSHIHKKIMIVVQCADSFGEHSVHCSQTWLIASYFSQPSTLLV